MDSPYPFLMRRRARGRARWIRIRPLLPLPGLPGKAGEGGGGGGISGEVLPLRPLLLLLRLLGPAREGLPARRPRHRGWRSEDE